MSYKVIVPKPVQKQIKNLPQEITVRIIEKVKKLSDEPRPLGSKKLKGTEKEYRIRIGDYRVRYEVYDDSLTVVLLNCRHRREAYSD